MIKPNEIKSVEDIGFLDNSPVRMVRTVGGLWIATGKPSGKKGEEALAAGSHPALVKHNIEKMYGNKFQPSLTKSETGIEPKVSEHTSQLNKSLSDKGYTLHSVEIPGAIDFIVSKRGIEVMKHSALIKAETLEFQGSGFKNMDGAKEAIEGNATKSVILAAVDVANQLNKNQIVCKDAVYKVK